jgi:predicted Zn-dependent protease
LPHSRKHELEADRIGIQLMAQAGYDPSEAPRFWKRFGELNTEKPAEWSSTHPSDQRRAEELSELLPEADLAYQSAPQRWGIGESV